MNEGGMMAGSVVAPTVDGAVGDTEYAIVEGYFDLASASAGKYRFEFNFELTNGIILKATYDGALAMENNISTITGDVQLGKLTGPGRAAYMGVVETGAKCHKLLMASEGLNETGTGDMVILEIFSTSGDATSLPAGKYPLDNSAEAGTSLSGRMSENNDFGAWYYILDEGSMSGWAPIASGEVNVAKNGNVYTVAFTGNDGYGHNISGSYEGELQLVDATAETRTASWHPTLPGRTGKALFAK
jgi:hypothetical protein